MLAFLLASCSTLPRESAVPSFPVTAPASSGASIASGQPSGTAAMTDPALPLPTPAAVPSGTQAPPATPAVSPVGLGRSVSGIASWYRYHRGQAAAGPALRRFLGPGWRGEIVKVCRGTVCLRLMLTDWMRADRLIDLDPRDFAVFAPVSRGLVRVTVSRVKGE